MVGSELVPDWLPIGEKNRTINHHRRRLDYVAGGDVFSNEPVFAGTYCR